MNGTHQEEENDGTTKALVAVAIVTILVIAIAILSMAGWDSPGSGGTTSDEAPSVTAGTTDGKDQEDTDEWLRQQDVASSLSATATARIHAPHLTRHAPA